MRQINLQNIFSNEVRKVQLRVTDNKHSEIELNRNEFPEDLPDLIKDEILQKLSQYQWNRYPKVKNNDLIKAVAEYNLVDPEAICLGAGAAMLITSLLNYFALNRKKFIILRPSFSLYEYHCNTYSISYTPWLLNEQLQFDLSTLPAINKNSIILLASPNNPTGSTIKQDILIELLSHYPDTLFIVDEVYHEFSHIDNTPMLNSFNNLILVRSFSKSLMTAGIRLGYCLSAPSLREQIEKVILPFSINHFAACTANFLLRENIWRTFSSQNISSIISERDRVYNELKSMNSNKKMLTLYPSKANFLLIRLDNEEAHKNLIKLFEENRIAILDTSRQPAIPNSIRLTIGTKNENQKVLEVFKKFLN